MRYRNFGNIKALFHFDFPYIHEPGDGRRDEVTGSYDILNNNNVIFAGKETAEKISDIAPKFGYRCPYFSKNGELLYSEHENIIGLIKTGNCEIDFWACFEPDTTGYVFALKNNAGNNLFALNINAGALKFSNGDNSASISPNTWTFLRTRISNGHISLIVDGQEAFSMDAPDFSMLVNFSIGDFKGYIDELIFREGTSNNEIINTPAQGALDVNLIGAFGSGQHLNCTLSSNAQINSYGLISASSANNKLTISNWNRGKFGTVNDIGTEILIHVSLSKGSNFDLLGLYSFRRIISASGNVYTLDSPVSEFDLSEAVNNYYVQAVSVPNFKNFTLESNATITPLAYGNNHMGGIVALRASENCNIYGKILSHGYGPVRNDLLQMCNSELIDRFLLNSGGGIFISCGGTFTTTNTARLGASWDGSLGAGLGRINARGTDGGAGYGGGGGGDDDSNARGGNAGVGGGGGSHDGSPGNSYSNYGSAGNENSTGGYAYYGGVVQNNLYGGTQGVNAGGAGFNSRGGGGALGNGGARAGACLILIAKNLNADSASISTGGEGGANRSYTPQGGGGSGLCYIACEGVN